jgi:hypothetical protein
VSDTHDSDTRYSLSGEGIELIWTAAIALVFVTVGYVLLPGFIRMMGKSGRIESVEWSLFLLLGLGFPVVAAAAGWLAKGMAPSRARMVSAVAVIVVIAFALWSFFVFGIGAFATSVGLALTVVAVVQWARGEGKRDVASRENLISVLVLAAVWECVLKLASWTDATGWITQSARTPILTILVAAASAITIAAIAGRPADDGGTRFRFTWVDGIAIVVFVILAFRTTPIVEFYHWSFWVGPVESIRQGGWLLWDVPSQYGFLSVLLPSLLPAANGWEAIYLFQAALYVVTAIAIYVAIASLRPGIIPRLVAFGFTATAYFFRPRTFPLIIPAQDTPAGGPLRFFWCYAMLLVIAWKYYRGDKVRDRTFAIVGTVVWVLSVAWSAESAIYTTVAWAAAYSVFLLQGFFASKSSDAASTKRTRNLIAGFALPIVAIVIGIAVVTVIYKAGNGHAPDWRSYYEYALLFSAGYSALPADPRGAVWYLVVLFIVASGIVVRFLTREPASPKLFVAVGAWGTIWAISSYFVSRSHPVNLLTLVPLLVFSIVIMLHLLGSGPRDSWSSLLTVVTVPLVTMPIVLTLAHAGFPNLLFREQSPMSKLTVQVPAMDPSLAQLATTAGIRPSDPVFYVSEGKFLTPRWPALDAEGRAEIDWHPWAPEPFEVISTLPAGRRDLYITRFQGRFKTGGWLLEKKSEINSDYSSVLALIERSYSRSKTFENDKWLVYRYEPLPAPR